MRYYAGLDVSFAETSVCVVDEHGDRVQEAKVASEPEALAQYLVATGLPFTRVGLEAGPFSEWLYTGMAEAGLPVFCIETRRTKATLSAVAHKTDRNDARGIAQMMRTGWFTVVHVKTTESQELRTILVARKHAVQMRQDLDGAIRGVLRKFGLKLGPITSRFRFEDRVRELVVDRPTLLAAVEPLLRMRGIAFKEENGFNRLFIRMAKQDEVCRRLTTVPGVGVVTALTFKSGIDIPSRFRNSKAVGAHFGLVPRQHQSGEVDRKGAITKSGNGLVRAALFEAASAMLTRSLKWSALKGWAVRVAQRQGRKRATVALARKLAVILHRMWVDETEFRFGTPASQGAAA